VETPKETSHPDDPVKLDFEMLKLVYYEARDIVDFLPVGHILRPKYYALAVATADILKDHYDFIPPPRDGDSETTKWRIGSLGE
jgi:hypothetical protein